MIRIVHADDHTLVREGLGRLLIATGKIDVVATANDGRLAVDRVAEHSPDVALLDLSMPNMDGLQAARLIRTTCPRTQVVILTMYEDEHHAMRTLRTGALGFLCKSSTVPALVEGIEKVHAGKRAMPPSLRHLEEIELEPRDTLATWELSKREFQVLYMLADCRTSREIAEELGLSVKTIDSHRGQILRKLGLRNNSEITRFAIRHNLIEA